MEPIFFPHDFDSYAEDEETILIAGEPYAETANRKVQHFVEEHERLQRDYLDLKKRYAELNDNFTNLWAEYRKAKTFVGGQSQRGKSFS